MIRFDNHAFKGLDQSLRQLFELLQSMGSGVEALMAILPDALEAASPEMFTQAKTVDKTINSAELAVDATVAAMINKFSIMGEDLRFVLAAIKIAGTLERMADKIKNCTKRLSRIAHPMQKPVKAELALAIQSVGAMVPLALEQIVDYSGDSSQELLKHGAAVQQAYRGILLKLQGQARTADDETHILLVAKNLEQAADMAVDIMKTCHYVHTGMKYEKKASVN